MNTSSEKAALRKQMKTLRKEAQSEQKAEKIAENLYKVKEFLQVNSYFIYNSFGAEVPTMPVIKKLLAEGKRVYLPRVENSDMVAVCYQQDVPMSESNYGIFEPTGEAYEGNIDVVILPLLAATKEGDRLGYGGGYYDRYLAKHPQSLKIGISYDEQIVENVYAQSHDIKLDMLITDKRILTFEED